MTTREIYARIWARYKGRELSVGLELLDGEPEHIIRAHQDFLEQVAMDSLIHYPLDSSAAAAAERQIKSSFGDRAYFVEIDSGPDDVRRGVQVFQPYGLPKTAQPARTVVQHEPGCFLEPRTPRGCSCGRDHQ